MANPTNPTADPQASRSTESETRQTAEKSASLLLLALLKQWKRNAPPGVEAKIGPNPEVSVRVGENQVYKGLADSPQIAAIPQNEIDYLKFATSLEQGYSHADLTRDVEIKIGGHKVFEVVGGEVTRNQIGPSQDQKISIDIPGKAEPQTELQDPTQTSGPSAQAQALSKFVVGMESHIKSMPEPAQAKYEGRIGDILTAEKFVDYKDKANALSMDLYGKSYDTIQQETQLQTGQAGADQELPKDQGQSRNATAHQVVKPSSNTQARDKPAPASKSMDLNKEPGHRGTGHKADKLTEREDLHRSVVGMKSYIHSMPLSEQAQYSEKLDSIGSSTTYDEYKDRVNGLSTALYGKSYDSLRRNSELESASASQDQGLSDDSSREPAQESVVEGIETNTVSAPEPGSKEDVLDAARYIAKEMGESDYSGGRTVETDHFKIEVYGDDLKVFDQDGNKAIEIDQIGGIDSYQPTPELVGVLTASANELEKQEIEHETPEMEVDEGIEIDDD